MNADADYEVMGGMQNDKTYVPNEEDKLLLDCIKNTTAGKNKGSIISWPEFSDRPLSEYSGKKIFCMLYPWLYPGGNGDLVESRNIPVTPKQWAQHQLCLKDGRFAKDKTWCFYALNFIERRRNMDQGRWFIKNFLPGDDIKVWRIYKKNYKKMIQDFYQNCNILVE